MARRVQLPPHSQLELMQGEEMLTRLGINDADAGLTRFAARMTSEAAEYDARDYPTTLNDKLDEIMNELTDSRVQALVGGSRTLQGRRAPGARKNQSELTNDRARLRHLIGRIINAYLREFRD